MSIRVGSVRAFPAVLLRCLLWSASQSRYLLLALDYLRFSLPLYPFSRRTIAPQFLPSSFQRGDSARGEALLSGVCCWGGRRIVKPNPFWSPLSATRAWSAKCHGFEWLFDLRAAAASRDAKTQLQPLQFASERMLDWIARYKGWSFSEWRPSSVRERLFAWLVHYDWYAPAFSSVDLLVVNRLLYAHYRHLWRLSGHLQGAERIEALALCLSASLCFSDRLRSSIERALSRALDRQVPLADGLWYGRKPCLHLQIMERLLETRALYSRAQILPPEGLLNALDRMAPALKMMRYSDGKLATFQGGSESHSAALERVLKAVQVRAQTPLSAPSGGFERMSAEKAVLLVDSASFPKHDHYLRSRQHASPLAFEFVYEKDRVIVNCALDSAQQTQNSITHRAARSTAAHSTICLEDRNASDTRVLAVRGAEVRTRRIMEDGETRLSLMHNGYRALFGIDVQRDLHLSRSGALLFGQDQLLARGKAKRVAFAIRFHLHPKVRVFRLSNGKEAVLRADNRSRLRFSVQGARLALEPSLYAGAGGAPRATRQIVLSGEFQPLPSHRQKVVRWTIKHEIDAET